jgi:hypothetical protein
MMADIPLSAVEHLNYADQFYEAFCQLPERQPPRSWPRYFLLCHSIELALKAHLARRGATPEQLRKFELRHNLDQLMDEAVEKGLPLPRPTQELIKALSEAHSKFWHRLSN